MATPRYKLVDEEHACCYHLASRCVRRAWLYGDDPLTGRNCSHRKEWLIDQMRSLARCFAVEIFGYAVMANHFHLVLYYDPKACESWSDEDVATRWVDAFPPKEGGQVVEERKAETRQLMLDDPERLERARRTLGSLSAFMKHLKQPIARRANLEDGCEGHFFEQRFYSGALLDDDALLTAMAYVDLNPVRAGEVQELIDCQHTSIGERLRENDEEALEEYLGPLISGVGNAPAVDRKRPRPTLTIDAYASRLKDIAAAHAGKARASDQVARWFARVSSLRKRQRAYGSAERLRKWTSDRAMQLRETPLPA